MAFATFKVPTSVIGQFAAIDAGVEFLTRTEPQDYHITLCYFGNEMKYRDYLEACKVCADYSLQTAPILMKGAALDSFPQNPDDKDGFPTIIRVISKELHGFRENLTETFWNKGIEFSKKFPGYKPHVTLGYAKEPVKIKPLEKIISWTCNEFYIYGGPKDGPPYSSWLLNKLALAFLL